jgi:DNA-binding response OmpR family regulator
VIAANKAARLGVLLVEDEEEIVELMRDFLEAEGFEVKSAATGKDALRLLELARVDCVLLDVMLPGESGFEICRQLRSRCDVPIVFLTARAEDSDKIRGLRLGADEVLVAGRPKRLTAKEFSLLRLFAEHPRQVFSRITCSSFSGATSATAAQSASTFAASARRSRPSRGNLA